MVHISLHSQLFLKLPVPTKTYEGQTIIVTGSNVGMGLEAARHFVRLNAEKVILAVRTIAKGEAAKASIEASTGRLNVVQVWELDLTSYASVLAFGKRAQSLERLDVVIENAGVFLFEFGLSEGNETTVTVNVISTLLVAMLLLPKMRETRALKSTEPVLSFVGSFTHEDTPFPERKASNIFESLIVEKDARMDDRYVSYASGG
jgi:retinol dehydrogenase-12